MNKTQWALYAQGVRRIYRDEAQDVEVLRDVNLQIRRGETVAIIGTSGAGKSTLLHILGGLDLADAGQIEVDGVSLKGLNDQQRGQLRNASLGFVYQFHHLLPEFSALDNVAMPLYIRRMDREQAQARAQATLALLGLSKRLDHLPSRLSGGERQRVAIARALVTKPACVLADEPTGNLDTDTAQAVFDLFLQAAREEQTAVLIVTHDRELAKRCDRILRLHEGQLIEEPMG